MADALSQSIRILLVDDQPDFLETISFWMKSKGYTVTVAYNGAEALKVVQNDPVDIVFLDVHMPHTDGIVTLTQIRQLKKDLPVILVTAYPEDETMDKARQLGISGFFPKEGGFDKLMMVIEVALRTHRGLRP